MAFSPPSRPHNGKRKRPASSASSQQPKAKRAAVELAAPVVAPLSNDLDEQATVYNDTIHLTLPSYITKLHKNQRPAIHDLTIISSSKINQKVTQILGLLLGSLADEQPKKDGEAADEGADQVPESVNFNGIIVRLSAKSAVASKAITVAEIVKREIRARASASTKVIRGTDGAPVAGQGVNSSGEGIVQQLFQYTQVHGVRLPPKQKQNRGQSKHQRKDDSGGKHTDREPEGGAGDGGVRAVQQAKGVAPPSTSTAPEPTQDLSITLTPAEVDTSSVTIEDAALTSSTTTKEPPLKPPASKGKKTYTDADGYLVTRNVEDGDDDLAPSSEATYQEGDTTHITATDPINSTTNAPPSSSILPPPSTNPASSPVPQNGADDEADDFEPLKAPADRRKEKERLDLIHALADTAEAKQQRREERPTAVLTIWLCTRRLNGLRDEFGEEVVGG